VKTGRGVSKGCCLLLIIFNLYSQFLMNEAREGFGAFRLGGQVIHTMKYTDDLVLCAKEETVLQGMIDRLIEIGRCCRMEIKEKTKVMKT
jgi:hypothetical protein